MNYFNLIPEDILYEILGYLDTYDIKELSEGLKLYVDYRKVMLLKYPKNYRYLLEEFQDDFYHYLNALELLGFHDDLRIVHMKGLPLSETTIFISRTTKIFNILCKIKLKLDYPDLHYFFLQFPFSENKYKFILHAMDDLMSSYESFEEMKENTDDDYLNKAIFEKLDTLDFDLLYDYLYNGEYNYEYYYILILLLKYKFKLDEFPRLKSNLRAELQNKIKRGDIDNTGEFEFETKILEKIYNFE